ncbi:MAG: FecR domain-containing protein [Elusimicrobia bacterium]|nr:FecR domain-containing protein [Elusimicrobiota bacterium]
MTKNHFFKYIGAALFVLTACPFTSLRLSAKETAQKAGDASAGEVQSQNQRDAPSQRSGTMEAPEGRDAPSQRSGTMEAPEGRDARLVEWKGSVWVRQSGGEWEPIPEDSEDVPLEEGEAVKTGPEPSKAIIQIDKDNTFELGPNTVFEVTSTHVTWSKFKLFMGSFLGKIEEKLEEKRRSINIIMPVTTLAVRGTEFAADTAGTDAAEGGVGVFEGRVEATMTDLEGAPSVQIGPGEEIDLVRSGPPPKPRQLRRF